MDSGKVDTDLKHLGFVRLIAINAVICVSNLYDYTKQSSSSLKSAVDTVESAVVAVVGPVYVKVKGVPDDLLVFLDTKVEEAAKKFDEQAPALAKQLVSQTRCMVQKMSQLAQNVVEEAMVGGPCAAINYACTLYKQYVMRQLAKVGYGINQIPPLNAVARTAIPTVAHLAERYNKGASDMAAGFTIFSHLPLVPIDEMTKAYKQVEAAKEGSKEATGSDQETEVAG